MSAREDFWSRRKARVAAEQVAEAEALEQAKVAEAHAALEEKSDDEILQELGLPEPESLSKGDDFSAFMAKAVPDRIRRRALRRLWVSNPVLANLDGLLDYGEDFTDKATVIENLQTAYQVGKGMTAHVEELARQAQLDREEGEAQEAEPAPVAAETEAPEADEVAPPAQDPAPVLAAAPEPAATGAAETAAAVHEADEDWAPPPRRRMQFTFDGDAT